MADLFYVSVSRRRGRVHVDHATITRTEEDLPVTQRLHRCPPVDKSVSFFTGTFNTIGAAKTAIWRAFPNARITEQ